ncbi:IS3 family transposase [Streptomyces mirabilis]|uniref:IS3 family transposase n=1 Tax=Streptomyces mirabilis TaxID=68239 RepID=UPI0036C245F1
MTIKTECIRGRVFATRAEANLALFEYIDGFYDSRRIQKRLGHLSPVEAEPAPDPARRTPRPATAHTGGHRPGQRRHSPDHHGRQP